MLRQLHIFYKGENLFSHSLAMALGPEELNNVKKVIASYIEMPMPGKTFHRPISNYQIFHRGAGDLYLLLITDLIDSIDYIDKILKKLQDKFKELFPNPKDINESEPSRNAFIDVIFQAQSDLHSKIAIVGQISCGKTTLYNMLRDLSAEQRQIMNFSKVAPYHVGELVFDLWDFQLQDNFSLMWPKFIGGSDLVLLLIDLSKYNLKVVSHYLNFQNREAKYSKFIVFGTKSDLVNEEDIKVIRNELADTQINVVSLIQPNAKEQVLALIREKLNLKKPLPPNFGPMIQKAEKFEAENNLINGIAAYKELINICNKYQEVAYGTTFQKKLDVLQEKRAIQIEEEKEAARREKFSAPDKIDFGGKVSVKTLPAMKKLPSTKPQGAVKPQSAPVQPTPTPAPKIAPKPVAKVAPKPVAPKPAPKKLTLSANDIKITIPALPGKKKLEENKNQDNPGNASKPGTPNTIRPIHFIPYDKNISDDIITDSSFDFAQVLFEIIEKNGSYLSKPLCEQYINEMLKSLERPLSIDDLNLAAQSFINKESSS